MIQRYHSVAYIYDHLDELDIKPGVRKKLAASKDNALLSRMLGEIVKDAPIDTELEHYRVIMRDRAACARYMARLELFSLIDKYDLEVSPDAAEAAAETAVLCVKEGEIPHINEKEIFLQFEITDQVLKHFAVASDGTVYLSRDEALFDSLLADEGRTLYLRGSKALFAYADARGTEVRAKLFDVELAAYLLEPSSKDYTDENLCAANRIELPVADDEAHKPYRALAVYRRLCDKLLNEIRANGQESLLFDIEIPLARVLAKMENVGFGVDRQGIADYGAALSAQIAQLEEEIYQAAGSRFNINSPKQLGKILFEDLGLPAKKKTKSGYSTNAEVLEGLRYEHPVVEMVLQYRTLAKLNSTYCEGLLKVIAADGRIHSSFNQTETRTGRISSTEPNLQNIPVRTELGREMRKFLDRAARAGTYRARRKYEGGVPQRRRYPRHHRLAGVQPAPGNGDTAHAQPRQSRQFRHRLRHRRVLAEQGHRCFDERSIAVYQQLSRTLQRRRPLYARGGRAGKARRLCVDDVRQAALSARAKLRQAHDARLR